MKTQSIIITILTGIISFGLLIFLARMLTRRLNLVRETETGLKLSYPIHVGSIVVSGCLLLAISIPLVSQGFDIMWNLYDRSYVFEFVQFAATILGFSFLWLTILYYLNRALMSVALGKRDDAIEMERDNFALFLCWALSLIGLAILGCEMLKPFLMMFIPEIEVPFYH